MPTIDISKTLEQIKGDTLQALGLNLISLILYGSHARGEATKSSNINIFIVVKEGTAKDLQYLSKSAQEWLRAGVTPPVIIEQEQFLKSFDTFALEYLEMSAARKILHGEDLFADFRPNWAEVREELEREARQKAIQLTQHWLSIGTEHQVARRIIIATAPGYFSLLRGLVLLEKKEVEPITMHAVLAWVGTKSNLDGKIWRKIWGVAKENELLKQEELQQLMKDYLDQAFAISKHIDGLSV